MIKGRSRSTGAGPLQQSLGRGAVWALASVDGAKRRSRLGPSFGRYGPVDGTGTLEAARLCAPRHGWHPLHLPALPLARRPVYVPSFVVSAPSRGHSLQWLRREGQSHGQLWPPAEVQLAGPWKAAKAGEGGSVRPRLVAPDRIMQIILPISASPPTHGPHGYG